MLPTNVVIDETVSNLPCTVATLINSDDGTNVLFCDTVSITNLGSVSDCSCDWWRNLLVHRWLDFQ